MRCFGRPTRLTSAYQRRWPPRKKSELGKRISHTLLTAPVTPSWKPSFRPALLLRSTASPYKSIEMTLRLDYSNMMISPGGIDPKAWGAAAKQLTGARRGFDVLRSGGSVGFVNLPSDSG